MSNFDGTIDPAASWADVPSLATDCDNLAGPGGPLNAQAVALAARTKSLKATTDAQTTQIAANSAAIGANSSAISVNSSAITALQANSGVTAGTYGDATKYVSDLAVNANGKITSISQRTLPSAPDLTPYLQKAGGTMTGAFNLAHGADIASAGTVNLTTATGNLVDITGTTTITAITLAEGADRIVRFTGALTLTNGASLVLPGGANITTAAGDYAFFSGYSGGVVRCTGYSRANGFALAAAAPGSKVLLGQTTQSGVAQIDVEGFFDATYDRYEIEITSARPATDTANIWALLKVGGTYQTANYDSIVQAQSTGTTTYYSQNNAASAQIALTGSSPAAGVSNLAACGADITFHLSMPADTVMKKRFFWHGLSHQGSGGGTINNASGWGNYTGTPAALTGVRLKASSGNISATVRVFGIKNS